MDLTVMQTIQMQALRAATGGGSEPPNCRYGSAKPECRQPKLINPERAMESAGNSRLRVGEQAPPSSRRCARPLSPPGEGAVCGHRGQPKVIHSDLWIEWGNVRLCSLMFAYVRLTGEEMLGRCARPLGLQNARDDERAKPVRNGR